MASILERIVETKRQEVERLKGLVPIELLRERIQAMSVPLNLSGTLMGGGPRLIAEAKKASPSRGLLRQNYDPAMLAKVYAENGAAAVSVLTEKHNFQGSLDDMEAVKEALTSSDVPVLRKDFIFDAYQIHEARAYGADAILLIVSILTPELLRALLDTCNDVWVQALVEVHSEEEMETALEAGAEIIGINNRDLRTFETDISVTERLAPQVPRGKILVSESGIHNHDDVVRLGHAGVHGVLVGEAIVTAPDSGLKIRELIHGER